MIRATLDYLYLIKNQKRISEKQLNKLQLKELKKIFHHAIKNSHFYNDLYKDYSFNNINDFYRLPTINKEIMMNNFDTLNTYALKKEEAMAYAIEKELNSDYLGYYKNKFVLGLSSGTSGNKGLYITPKSLTKRLPAVFLARGGLKLSDLPLNMLFCLRVFSQGFNDINAPFLKLQYVSTMEDPNYIFDTINKKKINVLMAPPSFLRTLLPMANLLNVKLKKVITYAEVLSDVDKEQFKKAFNTNIIEIYQASEGQIASSCHLGKLHLNEDLVFVELYDENNNLITKPNIVGHKMIITNLINNAQPLIRYQMNDMIVLDEPCSCGSSFRTIKKILGRNDDLIYFLNSNNEKRVVYPDLIARWIITTSDNIREFQVIQNEVGHINIYLDLINSFDLNELKKRFDLELEKLDLHGSYKITTQKIELPKHLSKYKRFISKL